MQLENYLPIFLQVVIAVIFAAGALITSVLIGQKGRRSPLKDTPYECGKPAIGVTNPRFSVKFYMIAMLFILFDIETVFILTWGLIYREAVLQGLGVLWGMISFIIILLIAFLYAYKRRVFEWVKES
ncbi:MAG: NADH-quinone oxidoreductase subunit A [Methylacidiphilales bacterium]|nr:NADH-quinone oxidoreductase subunit A [Candidatus Methylacidiphilales bacterium]MDW8349901.1 NADH-quinone oxidoreductase subunit A [Verrucomicrobiae bacterium]